MSLRNFWDISCKQIPSHTCDNHSWNPVTFGISHKYATRDVTMKRSPFSVMASDRLTPSATAHQQQHQHAGGWRVLCGMSVRHQHLWVTTSATAGHSYCGAGTPAAGSPCRKAHQLLRKYRRHRIRVQRKREYNRLRAMVPSIATQPKVSNVTVIEEAIKYIDQLHCAILSRFRTRGLPRALEGMGIPKNVHHLDQSEIREMLRHMLPSNHPQQQQHVICADDDEVERRRQSILSLRSQLQRSIPRRPPM